MQQRFAFEGADAVGRGALQRGADPRTLRYPGRLRRDGVGRALDVRRRPTFIVEPASAASISDLETSTGHLGGRADRLHGNELLGHGQLFLVLADVNDPANAGTLLRSADAFGCAGVVFGRAWSGPVSS